MRKGFTLLEVLVASLLLGMLVTILTMVFNQSSVAWRIGIAGVADLGDRRHKIAATHSLADAALPRAAGANGGAYRIVSPWKDGQIRTRAVEKAGAGGPTIDFNDCNDWVGRSVDGGAMNSSTFKSYVVGVTSAGPDRSFGTADDISTMPREASK